MLLASAVVIELPNRRWSWRLRRKNCWIWCWSTMEEGLGQRFLLLLITSLLWFMLVVWNLNSFPSSDKTEKCSPVTRFTRCHQSSCSSSQVSISETMAWVEYLLVSVAMLSDELLKYSFQGTNKNHTALTFPIGRARKIQIYATIPLPVGWLLKDSAFQEKLIRSTIRPSTIFLYPS